MVFVVLSDPAHWVSYVSAGRGESVSLYGAAVRLGEGLS